ncbi:GNAT family N-acetyltransferase [Mucilaginibacter psychrotolerans]|uniref:GNAT family N-acetyltransferase n=1 Tax=Mucilaginibacter psychrotolerans TaxID=1524096 RepID=A0A4Y8SPR2_9SPHI|nr:GNAT family N-acetyltransferase [Mucilaginibacter psychrotolerans]TFF40832.1 GNAT family N-acetyltransferase [Mucilaginibacter psychrotolerans]
MAIEIRKARPADYDGIWEIFSTVIKSGDTYAFDPATTREGMMEYWLTPGMETFAAVEDGKVIGTYYLKPNQVGLGNHTGNCGYMVHPGARGKGLGAMLCGHSIATAKAAGYLGIQFNFVVSTNATAVKLWQKLGFTIIGTTPNGFRHQQLGLVDTYIMYQAL